MYTFKKVGSPCGLVANMQDCNIIVSEFEVNGNLFKIV